MDQFIDRRALTMLQNGLIAAARKKYTEALTEFQASANLKPTPEAYTYWGWMEHQIGNTSEAIRLCHHSIYLDPEFGNPYNDIGSYLVFQGKPDEAMDWFHKAIRANRYQPRQYPHLNLGRIYFHKKEYGLALYHFRKASDYCPEDEGIRQIIDQVLDRIC